MIKTLQISGSKSIAQRALICAALCPEPTILKNLPPGDDVQNLIKALEQCGVSIENPAKNSLKLTPNKFPPDKKIKKMFVGHGGTPLRFLTSFLCQIPGTQELDGSPRLRERPILPLIEALQKAGAKISRDFPLKIGDQKLAEEIEIDASASSQFLSSLLLSAKALGIKKIKICGKKTSSSYLDLTIKVLADFGIKITEKADFYEVSGNYQSPRNYEIEPDWASAGYLLGATLLANLEKSENEKFRGKIAGLKRNSLQPDARILPVLEKMGLEVGEKDDYLEFSAKNLQSPGKINCEKFPDSAQTLAVLSAFCAGEKTELTGLQTLPHKECHRLESLQSELAKMGISSEISRDSLKIFSSKLPLDKGGWGDLCKNPIEIKTFHDHRMALAFGMTRVIFPNLKIENPSVVKKSFPSFWNELSKLQNPAKKITIIGDPVAHSLTPLLYNSAFAELGMNFVCEKRQISRENLEKFLAKNDYYGLAITAPHKENSAKFLSRTHPSSNSPKFELGINSLRYGQKIRGENTDIPGIREVLQSDLQDGRKVLILGAGATAHSVLEALQKWDLEIFIHNRTPEKAENLAKKYSATAVKNLAKISPEIVISTLPFDCEPTLTEEIWKTLQTVFVIGYNGKILPQILAEAKSREKNIRTGGDLLWAQWTKQFEFLFDLPAPTDAKNLLKSFTILTK